MLTFFTTRRWRSISALALITSVAFSLSSCSPGASSPPSATAWESLPESPSDRSDPTGPPEGMPRVSMEASWTRVPSSAEELARAATTVVLAHWSGKTRTEEVGEGLGKIGFPVSTMIVDRVIKGDAPLGDIAVRSDVTTADGHSPLDTDFQYLLYLRPFWFKPTVETGEWIGADGPFSIFVGDDSEMNFYVAMNSGDERVLSVTMEDAEKWPVSSRADVLAAWPLLPGTAVKPTFPDLDSR